MLNYRIALAAILALALCGKLAAEAPHCSLSESQIKERLRTGQPLSFNIQPDPQNASAESTRCRTVQADWITSLVDETNAINVRLSITNGYVVGTLNLRNVTFREPVSITRTDFEGEVYFTGSTFVSVAVFDSSMFNRHTEFLQVHARNTLSFQGAHFALQSIFNGLDARRLVLYGAYFDNPQFYALRIADELMAQDVEVTYDAPFDNSVIGGRADLRGIRCRGLGFRNAQLGSLDFSWSPMNNTNLDSADLSGMIAKDSVSADKASIRRITLRGAQIGAGLNLAGVRIGTSTEGIALDFSNVTVGSLTNLGSFDDLGNAAPNPYLKGHAIFRGGHLLGGLETAGATFDGEVDFTGAEIIGDVLFEEHEHIQKPWPCSTEFDILPHTRQCASHMITVFKGHVTFAQAVIKGRFFAAGAQFEQGLSLDGIQIDRNASISAAVNSNPPPNKIYDESRTILRDLFSVNSARFRGPLSMKGASIAGSASFEGIHFSTIDARDISIQGVVSFRSMVAAANAYGESDSIFEDRADFTGAHLHGVDFSGATFNSSLDLTQAEIDGDLLFSAPADQLASTFKGPVFLTRTVVKGKLSAEGSRFLGDARFDGSDIQGDAEFTNTQFSNGASFHLTGFDNASSFASATFGGITDFESAKFGPEATFSDAQFNGGARFDTSSFNGTALFENTDFHGRDPVTFQAVHFNQPVSFRGARFDRGASFVSTIADKSFSLQGSSFGGAASFRYAHLSNVSFGEDEQQGQRNSVNCPTFGSTVDLRGFTYDTISIPCWKDVLQKQTPYDREPYVQLEKIFRATGLNEEADKVYYARHEREGDQADGREPLQWLWDRSRRYLTGYGVALTPIIATSLSVLLLGSFVFSRPGAVKKKGEDADEGSPVQVPGRLRWFDSIAVSLRLLSGIDLPSGSEWAPSDDLLVDLRILKIRYSTYGTIQRIIGLLLVPIAAAAILDTLQRPGG